MKEYAGGSTRSLRAKRKTYTDGMESSDDEDDGLMGALDPLDIYEEKKYPAYFIKNMKGEDVNVEYFQRTGFKFPLLVKEKSGLNIRVPDSSFTVTDVKNLVGGRRILEVMNTATQSNAEMTLKDWEEFFMAPDRDDSKLNVISLEFSQTKLDNHVTCPRVVRQVDFTDNVWPRHLKDAQDDSTNDMARMLYPKVQKYCLMSINGCYTDFHVDLGGTSVWYHLLRGKKVFWLIPPTQANLKAFEAWTMSGKQSNVFFGDLVPRCGRVELVAGNTFFIPSGWIHAVFTPEDSLVFGGNFLHPYAIERQLKIAQLEESIKVPHKYRFPFFTEMMWYVLDKYCYALLGRHHLNVDQSILTRLLGTLDDRKTFADNIGHPHITPDEVRGLKSIVLYLHSLPGNKKNVPTTLKDPVTLVRDIRVIVEVHKKDKQERAESGTPLLYWPGIKNDPSCLARGRKRKCEDKSRKVDRIVVDGIKMINVGVECVICGLDGWWADHSLDVERNPRDCCLCECVSCGQVAHPSCLPDIGVDGRKESIEGVSGMWTCPECVLNPTVKNKEEQVPEDINKEESLNPTVDTKEETVPDDKPAQDIVTVKEEPVADDEMCDVENPPASITDGNVMNDNIHTPLNNIPAPLNNIPTPLNNLPTPQNNIPTPLVCSAKVSACIDRISQLVPHVRLSLSVYSDKTSLAECPLLLAPCLQLLSSVDLVSASQVCHSWYKVASQVTQHSPVSIDLTGHRLTSNHLTYIARRQPSRLVLDYTAASRQQLTWLLPKVSTCLTSLSLVGLDSASVVGSLTIPGCPSLTRLDLSQVTGLTDSAVCLLVRPREDKRSCLSTLTSLTIGSTDVTDISLRYICQYLTLLAHLSVSNCPRLTDAGLVQVGDPSLPVCTSLTSLDITLCPLVTDLSHLNHCPNIARLEFSQSGISEDVAIRFVSATGGRLALYNKGVICRRKK